MSRNVRYVVNMLAVIVAFIPLAWLLMTLPALPDQVPMHFDLAGTANRWASKYELVACGILAPATLAVCLLSQRFDFANLPARFTTHAQRQNAVAIIGLVDVVILDLVSFFLFHLTLSNL